ncbi:hypothetical protein Hanom_Chr08g00726051 [Helianthus anomalus]
MVKVRVMKWAHLSYWVLIVRVFKSFHTHLTPKTNLHSRQGLSGNEIAKVEDYISNFRKLGTKGEKCINHRDYPGIFLKL